jgi:single-stranded DNA-binding protein
MAINNTVILTGNTGAEAQVIETGTTTFAAVGLATTDSYQDEEGNWKDLETIWHDVITFNPKIIQVLKSLKTGSRIKVTGSLSYRPYEVMIEDKKIQKKEASIIAKKVEMAPLAKKPKSQVKHEEDGVVIEK